MNDFNYMNPPQETDGKSHIEFYKGKNWVGCPYCGKRQFPIEKDTKIKGMNWKCKGSSCKKEFEVDV